MTTPTRLPSDDLKTEGEDEPKGDVVAEVSLEADALPEPGLQASPAPKPVDTLEEVLEGASEPPRAESAPAEDADSKEGTLHWLAELLHDLAIAVVVCVLLITYVVQAFKVQGTSMSPELHDGERILVNKFMYRLSDIARGDVVVFWYPEDPELSFIKRVVALPGETVEIKNGDVFVDNVQLDESYVTAERADRRSHPKQEIRPGHYFVLGDNRRGSNDSRSWGLVPERYIYGRAFVRIWPPSDVGLVD